MNITKLYGRMAADIILSKAIEACYEVMGEGIALLYSPQECQFSRLDSSGKIRNAAHKEMTLDYGSSSIFEGRIFNENHELRWLNESEGRGRAVIISESKIVDCLIEDIAPLSALDTIEQEYLIWGERTNTQLNPGWQRLATARIGALDVPIIKSLCDTQRVYLKTREYLAEADKFGNVAVVEERLLKLEVK